MVDDILGFMAVPEAAVTCGGRSQGLFRLDGDLLPILDGPVHLDLRQAPCIGKAFAHPGIESNVMK